MTSTIVSKIVKSWIKRVAGGFLILNVNADSFRVSEHENYACFFFRPCL